MATAFTSKFNTLTDSKFEYLVLESVDVEIDKETVVVNLIYPEEKEQEVIAQKKTITDGVVRAMGLKSTCVVKLTKSHFDADFFKAKFLEFIDQYPSVSPFVFADSIKVEQLDKYAFAVKISVDEDIFGYITARNLTADVKKMLASSYCETISFEFLPVAVEKPDAIAEAEEALASYVYETNDGHFVIPQNVEEFVGKIVYDRAGYICDATCERQNVVYCGKVSEFTECERKPREGETTTKKFYKFTLTDPTGNLKCLFFPRKKKDGTVETGNIVNLENGKDVVVKGSLTENKFRGAVSYDMFVRSISLCTVPTEEFVIKKSEFKSGKEYLFVKPEPYAEQKQANIFDIAKEPAKWLKGKTFCVFDIETTGLDKTQCKIIEIGAVKVVDGHLTEKFSTFIDPREPISARITELTSISDATVAGAPKIEDVMPDFYKFAEGCTLVAHNAEFDVGFIVSVGKGLGMEFNHPVEDTMAIARKYFKDEMRNAKLDTVVKYFGLKNEHAHRAIYDAIATAKALIIMAERIE